MLSVWSCLLRNIIKGNISQINSSQSRIIGLNNFSSKSDETILDDIPINMVNPFEREKKSCILCKMNIEPDYKNVQLLSQFQSSFTGRIYGRNITGLCKSKQKKVERAIMMARNAGLMPYYHKKEEFSNDPPLFNPEKPIRPHNY